MIYIIVDKKEYGGHLGSNLEGYCQSLYSFDGEGVEVVQADGDELDYIKEKFSNIPFPTHKKAVAWYGDMAKFIVCNLF